MKRHEIITTNSEPTTSIEYGTLQPYLKSLYVYYKDLFNCEPILMVTDVFNAAQYAKIVPSNEFLDALCEYMGVPYIVVEQDADDFNEELFSQYETINFNSVLLSKLI